MEQIETSQKETKKKFIDIYNHNKVKIISTFFIIIFAVVFLIILKLNNEKKNTLISEKYIKAIHHLASSETDKAKLLFEQILTSGNKFYSILSLNTVIEKNLIVDKDKVIDYFNILENNITLQEQKDLLILKKALYLIQKQDAQEGKDLLNILIQNNSNLKSLAQEIVKK